MDLETLFEFMKKNKILKAKTKDIELELHPSAFYEQIPEESKDTEEQKDEYEKFIYPSQKDFGEAGL